MNPYDQVMMMYRDAGDDVEVPLEEMVAHHIHNGMLISTHGIFLACRPVRSSWSDEEHLDISKIAYAGEADCWMVWIAVGSMSDLVSVLVAHPFPWVSFSRGDSRDVTRVSSSRLYGITNEKGCQGKGKEGSEESAASAESG
jgi:hypothetical protein